MPYDDCETIHEIYLKILAKAREHKMSQCDCERCKPVDMGAQQAMPYYMVARYPDDSSVLIKLGDNLRYKEFTGPKTIYPTYEQAQAVARRLTKNTGQRYLVLAPIALVEVVPPVPPLERQTSVKLLR